MYNRENFQDWFADIGWINSLLYGNIGIGGVMCDDITISDPNYTEREGAAVIWPSIPNMPDAMRTAIHETGHCFNLQHYWGHCANDPPGQETITFLWYPACRDGSIMTYGFTPYVYYWYSFNLNFYQLAPESWAKSGRYGYFWVNADSPYPPFYQAYQ